MKVLFTLKSSRWVLIILLALGSVFQSNAQGTDTLATWELTGIPTTTPAWGASPLAAQNVSSAVTTSGWT
ncbi:MAG: hypothetical protein FJ350_02495, partial [Sphingomonadales bacterium]|nr:hypothetical protein [Sphingomonadales bacterium]